MSGYSLVGKMNLNIAYLCGKDNSMPKNHEIFINTFLANMELSE